MAAGCRRTAPLSFGPGISRAPGRVHPSCIRLCVSVVHQVVCPCIAAVCQALDATDGLLAVRCATCLPTVLCKPLVTCDCLWQASLAAAAAFTHANPVAVVALRAMRPGLFAAGISFEPLHPAAHLVHAAGASSQPQQAAVAWQLRSSSPQVAAVDSGNRQPTPNERHELETKAAPDSVSYLRLVSVPQGWAAVLAPCYRAVCSRLARSWGRSGIRLPW
jgi:hypothetical protein